MRESGGRKADVRRSSARPSSARRAPRSPTRSAASSKSCSPACRCVSTLFSTPIQYLLRAPLQLEAIEQNSEILGNLDGIDRCAHACARAFVHACASRGAPGLVHACVRGPARICVCAASLIGSFSKPPKTRPTLPRSRPRSRSAESPRRCKRTVPERGLWSTHTMCRTQVHARRGDVGARL